MLEEDLKYVFFINLSNYYIFAYSIILYNDWMIIWIFLRS